MFSTILANRRVDTYLQFAIRAEPGQRDRVMKDAEAAITKRAAGLLLGVGRNPLLVSQLELPKLPIVYLAVGSVVLWLVGVAAVYAPAWRASGISPAIATRCA